MYKKNIVVVLNGEVPSFRKKKLSKEIYFPVAFPALFV